MSIESKTKEQILKDKFRVSDSSFYSMMRDFPLTEVEDAMEQYARSRAIELSRWIRQRRIIYNPYMNNGYVYFYEDGEGAAKDDNELYELFSHSIDK